ncbi:MAG: hypothetical protein CYG59_18805, partial [Chloroflexi bacterium]
MGPLRYNPRNPPTMEHRPMNMPVLLLALALSYLLGAVPFAVLVGKRLRGIDVQRTGSGNAGAMNTFRNVGRGAGVLVALLDG